MQTTAIRTPSDPEAKPDIESERSTSAVLPTTLLASAAATACGGGGNGESGDAAALVAQGKRAQAADDGKGQPMSFAEASRLLTQAGFGGDRVAIERVQQLGVDAWLTEQFAMPRSTGHVVWLRSQGYDKPSERFSRNNLDYTVWRKFLSSPDGLRQRMVFALSQILVISVESIGGYWPAFAAAYYMDILEKRAFGNYRDLLQDVSLSPAMGRFLSIRRSRREDGSGRRPDENYAREVMQLFTIGLVNLNDDGTPKLDALGQPQPSYTEQDVAGLARVFTGYEYANNDTDDDNNPDAHVRPMVNNPRHHESGAKVFLGTTIPAGTGDRASLRLALDTLFKHPNVGPFIGRQLIQRFVTSNPSTAYVKRVAGAFADNGRGERGDLAAVLRAILTDGEARGIAARNEAGFGKLREPVLRFAQWARACKVSSASGKWQVPNLSNPVDRLGQNPMRSPSVFNFYRPGYVPPNSPLADEGKVAPEFQITTESSVAGYINFMQSVVSTGNGVINSDVKPNYARWLDKANDAKALANEANEVLAAGQLSEVRVQVIADAVTTMPKNSAGERLQRVQAAVLLTLVAPEYLSLK